MNDNPHKPNCPWYFINPENLSDIDLDSMDDTPCLCEEKEDNNEKCE